MSVLQYLLAPKYWYEKDIQIAIEEFWDALFMGYELVNRQRIRKLEGDWQPDLVGVDQRHGRVLIVELKGDPPNGNKKSAVAQVVKYGEEFHAQWPDISLDLLVIGPWNQKNEREEMEHNGYKVRVIDVRRIGIALLDRAENIFLWNLRNPFGCAREINLDLTGDLESRKANRDEENEAFINVGEEEKAA